MPWQQKLLRIGNQTTVTSVTPLLLIVTESCL